MQYVWWSLTLTLMVVGLFGTLLPIVPGTTIILAAAVLHRLMLGAAHSVSWLTIVGLTLLTVTSYFVEIFSSAWGAKWFGATRWGAIGGVLGAFGGLFFGLVGVFVGPLIGVLVGELLGGKELLPATRTTWGSLLGTTVGMALKAAIGAAMVVWFYFSARGR